MPTNRGYKIEDTAVNQLLLASPQETHQFVYGSNA
jgi:hypothetical protein